MYTDIKTVQRHLQTNASSRPPSVRTRTQSTTSDYVFPEYHDCTADGEFHAACGADEYYVARIADGECVVAGDAAGVIGEGSEDGVDHLDVHREQEQHQHINYKYVRQVVFCNTIMPMAFMSPRLALLCHKPVVPDKSRDHIESKATRTPYSTFTSTKKHFFTSPTNLHYPSILSTNLPLISQSRRPPQKLSQHPAQTPH
jgi:hypothetical protein